MYDLADVLPDAKLDPGTNVLVAGPPLTGKRQIAFDILASGGANRGDGSIIVTTKDSADKVLESFDDRVDEGVEPDIGVVDCVTKQRGIGTIDDDPRIKYASLAS